MTWSIDMLDADPTTGTGWWLLKCAAETARQGYSAILAARQTIAAIFGKV
jgi:hypothetical protein